MLQGALRGPSLYGLQASWCGAQAYQMGGVAKWRCQVSGRMPATDPLLVCVNV